MQPPDPDALAAYLAKAVISLPGFDELEFEALSPVGRVDAWRACERVVRKAQALLARSFAGLDAAARREADDVRHGVTEAELAAASGLAVSTIRNLFAEAGELTRRFPEALELLAAGEVSWPQVRALVALTSPLSDEHARRVQDAVLREMPKQSYARTRAAIHRAIITVDPDGEADRHAEQAKRRHMELRPEPHGMATLSIFTKAETARAMLNAVDAHCVKKADGDTRTLDQRRADTVAAMLLTGAPSGTASAPALVHVVVPVETLLGISDAPAQLEGYGPIGARQARVLATEPGSVLRRLVTASDGTLLHVGKETYRPDAAMAREVRAVHRTCTFPHCDMPATRSELDHRISYREGGRTVVVNLGPLCHFHHDQKTRGLWHVHLEGDTIVWISVRTSRRYTTEIQKYQVIADDELIE